MAEIYSEAGRSSQLYHGVTAVSVTPVPICANYPTSKGVLVMADAANTATIYVGKAGLTVDTGWPLPAGSGLHLSVDDPSKVFCLSTMANQYLRWIGV